MNTDTISGATSGAQSSTTTQAPDDILGGVRTAMRFARDVREQRTQEGSWSDTAAYIGGAALAGAQLGSAVGLPAVGALFGALVAAASIRGVGVVTIKPCKVHPLDWCGPNLPTEHAPGVIPLTPPIMDYSFNEWRQAIIAAPDSPGFVARWKRAVSEGTARADYQDAARPFLQEAVWAVEGLPPANDPQRISMAYLSRSTLPIQEERVARLRRELGGIPGLAALEQRFEGRDVFGQWRFRTEPYQDGVKVGDVPPWIPLQLGLPHSLLTKLSQKGGTIADAVRIASLDPTAGVAAPDTPFRSLSKDQQRAVMANAVVIAVMDSGGDSAAAKIAVDELYREQEALGWCVVGREGCRPGAPGAGATLQVFGDDIGPAIDRLLAQSKLQQSQERVMQTTTNGTNGSTSTSSSTWPLIAGAAALGLVVVGVGIASVMMFRNDPNESKKRKKRRR